ncbi:peptidase A8 [Lysobacter maris]|uniref:Lipoprotein signal peptidase n=2 Tax=Marilutibacter maris TaxID=1605891 RepID=A0A2U9T326_9GAMM|nr:peptidase A8 [Lysobacter maris]
MPMTASRPSPNALAWLLVSVLVIALDQLTKWWVLTSLPEYTAIPVIDGFWNWYRTYNTGAAFSFLSDAGGWQKYFFLVLAVAISGLLGWWLSHTPRRDWRTALPYALVIGGAIGNVIDRLMHGHVVDFIQWYWRDWYWPAFNIADSAIVAGAVGIALMGVFGHKAREAAGEG